LLGQLLGGSYNSVAKSFLVTLSLVVPMQ
jgi:hypothetical protein